MDKTHTTIFARSILVLGMLLLVWVAADARGQEPGITFATNGIDLKIDSTAFYNGSFFPTSSWYLKDLNPWADHFFDFDDVKPGDYGKTIISMHVKKTDAWMCLDFNNLESDDNGQNEPESQDDGDGDTDGELAENLFFFAWQDDGDNKFEVGEKPIFGNTPLPATEVLDDKSYPIADYGHGNSCREGTTRYVGIAWCAGAMTVDLSTAQISCDGSGMDNAAQTDSMSVDIAIRAVPTKQNPKFVCKDTYTHDDKDDHDHDKGDDEGGYGGHNDDDKGDKPDQPTQPDKPTQPNQPNQPEQPQKPSVPSQPTKDDNSWGGSFFNKWFSWGSKK